MKKIVNLLTQDNFSYLSYRFPKFNLEEINNLTVDKVLSHIKEFNIHSKKLHKKLLLTTLTQYPIDLADLRGFKYKKFGGIHRLESDYLENNSKEYITEHNSSTIATIVFNTLLKRKPRPLESIFGIFAIEDPSSLLIPDYIDIMIRLIIIKKSND